MFLLHVEVLNNLNEIYARDKTLDHWSGVFFTGNMHCNCLLLKGVNLYVEQNKRLAGGYRGWKK